MPRWYCVQSSDAIRGWVDAPRLAAMSKVVADRRALQLAEELGRVTRVIRKPHGWEPPKDELAQIARVPEHILRPLTEKAPEPVEKEPPEVALQRKHEKARRRRPKTWYARILGKDSF